MRSTTPHCISVGLKSNYRMVIALHSVVEMILANISKARGEMAGETEDGPYSTLTRFDQPTYFLLEELRTMSGSLVESFEAVLDHSLSVHDSENDHPESGDTELLGVQTLLEDVFGPGSKVFALDGGQPATNGKPWREGDLIDEMVSRARYLQERAESAPPQNAEKAWHEVQVMWESIVGFYQFISKDNDKADRYLRYARIARGRAIEARVNWGSNPTNNERALDT